MLRRYLLAAGLLASTVVSQEANRAEASHPLAAHHAPTTHAPIVAPTGPPYLLLQQSVGGTAVPVTGRPYAYGWFGVAPRRHTITHRGYYGSHWLWPGRLAP
jgi:hypothetical protein